MEHRRAWSEPNRVVEMRTGRAPVALEAEDVQRLGEVCLREVGIERQRLVDRL
jgi:hypothetical protein